MGRNLPVKIPKRHIVLGKAMDMFGRKKKSAPVKLPFDPGTQKAVLRCSICNGEQVAGFKDLQTGRFTEVCLIRNGQELEAFKEQYGITEIAKEY